MPLAEALAAPETEISARDFARVAAVVRAEAGIVLADGKRALVAGRLAKRLRALGLSSFADYCAAVERDPAERTRMVEALTTNHTSFFREGHHFDHLAKVALPELVAKAFAGGRLRIWSSAASTGEEPYSIAAVLLGEAKRIGGARWLDRADAAILATDLASHAVAAGRAARYPAAAAETFPPPLRDSFARDGDHIVMGEDAKALVHFRQLNLLGDWPIRGRFDVIFCRNVCIYFDQPTQERLWERFADALTPAGWLYIGHSERIAGPAARRLKPMGQTIYRLTGESQ